MWVVFSAKYQWDQKIFEKQRSISSVEEYSQRIVFKYKHPIETIQSILELISAAHHNRIPRNNKNPSKLFSVTKAHKEKRLLI